MPLDNTTPADQQTGGTGVIDPGAGQATAPVSSGATDLSQAASGGTAAASSAAPAGGASGGMESIRDTLTRLGATDLTAQFQDDTALLQHLLLERQQARQSQELANYGRQVIGNWPAVQEFLQKQAPGAKKEPEGPWWNEFWNPPVDFNPAWEKLILRDAQGNLHPAPGAPPDIVQRYASYRQFREQQIDKFVQNPFAFMEPAIKKLARQEAESIARQQIGQQTDQQFAATFIQQNSDWLYAKDQQGQPVVDSMTRQPMLSEWGTRFREHVVNAEKIGIKDIRAIQDYALRNTQFEYLKANPQAAGQFFGQNTAAQQQQDQQQQAAQQAAGGQQTPAQAANQQAKQTFLQNAAGAQHRPNVGPQGVNGNPAVNTAGLSLAQRLRSNLAAAGLKDGDL